jgi:ABC-2 type transport system ATP-binding protein
MIEVEGLYKSFGSTVAVKNVSFSVEKGEVVGFLGPNGAGKTTTMRILTGYIPADTGTATLAGFDVFDQSLEVRKRVGYLPENAPLYQDMGALEYLHFVAKVRSIDPAKRRDRIKNMIEVCGLRSEMHKDVHELSKGYRQRLCLAQALIHDPEILILDEPTVGLDPTQIIEIRGLIKKIAKEKTILLSSHILPEASATCDRIIIISKGELVGGGTPEQMAAMAKEGEIIHTNIRGPADQVEGKLRELAEVKNVRVVADVGDGLHQYEITSDPGVELSEKVFHLVAQNGWSLTELKKEVVDLEGIFLQLTKEA